MIIDIILIMFAIAGFWVGYTRGIAGTLLVVAGYVIALLITLKITPWLVGFLVRTINLEKVLALIFGTILVLVLFIFLVHFLARRIDHYFTKTKPPAVSKVFGGLVLCLVFMVFYGLVVNTLNSFRMVGEKARQSSISYFTLIAVPGSAKKMAEKTRPIFNGYWKLIDETIQHRQQSVPDSTKQQ